MAGTLYFVRRIVEHFTGDLFAMLGAAVLTAFYAPLISWSLLGMEVSVLAFAPDGCWIVPPTAGAIQPVGLYPAGGLDASALSIWPSLIWSSWESCSSLRSSSGAAFDLGAGPVDRLPGGPNAGREFYYGDWLPNTYYLKVQGWPFALRILRGLYALTQFAYYSNWVLFLLPFGLLLFRRDWKTVLLLGLIAGQIAYSVYVGGDAWEEHGGANRLHCPVMPLLFCLMAIAEELRRRGQPPCLGDWLAAAASRVVWLTCSSLRC